MIVDWQYDIVYINHTMEFNIPPTTEDDALRFLNNYWFKLAETIFKKVVEVCELNQEQIDSLKGIALKPMDFSVELIGMESFQ